MLTRLYLYSYCLTLPNGIDSYPYVNTEIEKLKKKTKKKNKIKTENSPRRITRELTLP